MAFSALSPSPDKYKTVPLEKFKVKRHSMALEKSDRKLMGKLEKKEAPSYGDVTKAFEFAYEKKLSPTPGKAPKISFAEEAAKARAKVPGVGSYQTEKAYNHQSFCSGGITARRRS